MAQMTENNTSLVNKVATLVIISVIQQMHATPQARSLLPNQACCCKTQLVGVALLDIAACPILSMTS